MAQTEKTIPSIGLAVPEILLPKAGTAPEKWAVIACDQYSSEPEYWERVKAEAGNAPSTLNLIFPECYLEEKDAPGRIEKIHKTMETYLAEGILESAGVCFVLTERSLDGGHSRWGLVAALDLEAYDYSRDSKSLIRATEGTIVDRIPPRKRIREKASLELPHILVLLDDPEKTVIEKFKEKTGSLEKLYDFDLMFDSGRLRGWKISSPEDLESITGALVRLKEKDKNQFPLLYAMGDGNHSLATAKAVWEDIKSSLPEETRDSRQFHPARYALVELENLHDPGILFEPIHRVLFNIPPERALEDLLKETGARAERLDSPEELMARMDPVRRAAPGGACFGTVSEKGAVLLTLPESEKRIPAAAVQDWLDGCLKTNPAGKVDYIHGAGTAVRLGTEKNNLGILLPAISKDSFFDTIRREGVFPRKTFSMGEAREKRFYMEARRIRK